MSSSKVLKDILSRLDVAGFDKATLAKVQNIVHEVGSANGVRPPGSFVRMRFARKLIDEGLSYPEIRHQLMEKLGCSRRSAYRGIEDAFAAAPYSALPKSKLDKNSYVIRNNLRGIPRELITSELIELCRVKMKITKLLRDKNK